MDSDLACALHEIQERHKGLESTNFVEVLIVTDKAQRTVAQMLLQFGVGALLAVRHVAKHV